MNFYQSNLYKNGMTTSFYLYLQDDSIIIWNFIRDPDTGERF